MIPFLWKQQNTEVMWVLHLHSMSKKIFGVKTGFYPFLRTWNSAIKITISFENSCYFSYKIDICKIIKLYFEEDPGTFSIH